MTTTIRPTIAQAEHVLELVASHYGFKAGDPYGPELRMEFDWTNSDGWPTVIWEGGPYDWAVDCSFALLKDCKPGVWLEPATSWALGIYVDV